MNRTGMKLVYFDQYCKKCKYASTPETEQPCYECLIEAVNQYSHKPIKYEDK